MSLMDAKLIDRAQETDLESLLPCEHCGKRTTWRGRDFEELNLQKEELNFQRYRINKVCTGVASLISLAACTAALWFSVNYAFHPPESATDDEYRLVRWCAIPAASIGTCIFGCSFLNSF